MNQDLLSSLDKLVAIFKKDSRCLGGWHFGSISRGLQDEFSDVDPIFLIKGEYFDEVALELPSIMAEICDEVVVFWKETYNNDELKSFGVDIRLNNKIHQFDVFIINDQKLDAWFCKVHYTDIKPESILFDKTGLVSKLIKEGPKGQIPDRDIIYCITTYWHHIHMVIKYFHRKDYFKLHYNLNIIIQAHADVLLSHYDTLTWGGWDSRVKRCVPEEKQKHLKKYFDSTDLEKMKLNLKELIEYFCSDASEICAIKGIEYPAAMEASIRSEFFNTF